MSGDQSHNLGAKMKSLIIWSTISGSMGSEDTRRCREAPECTS